MATRIHHYPWQDPGANQLKDQVGTLDGTWAGGTPLAPLKEGGIDRYIMYGSDNGYINFGNSDETTNFGSAAFMFEFRMRQHTRWNSENPALLWRRLNGSSHGVDIFSYANILYWRIRDPGGNVEVQYNIPADKLYKHYLLTKNGTEMRTIVNGASIGTTSGPATIADNTGQSITALYGQSVGYAILHTFDIDYISIWSGAFNTTEAAAYYATLDDIDVVFADDKNAFPVTNLDFQIAALAGGNIVQAGTVITLGGALAYDGSEFQSGYSTGSTITGDGGGGLLISVVPDTPWFEDFPFVLEVQSVNTSGTTIDRVYLTSTETLGAVKNSGFEAGSGGSALNWHHEGISPVDDIGTDSGVIDPLPWWVAPQGTKVDVLTSRLLSSLLGHVESKEVVLGTGDATYTGTLAKSWEAYIVPGTVQMTADEAPLAIEDDGSGGLYSPIDADIAAELIHYKMEDNAASVVVTDNSDYGFSNGSLIGGKNTSDVSVVAKVGRGFDMPGAEGDGLTSDSSLPAYASTDPWSFACWVYPRLPQLQDGGWALIVKLGTSPSTRLYYFDGASDQFYVESPIGNGGWVTAANVWYHVVLRYRPAVTTLELLVDTVVRISKTGALSFPSAPLSLMAYPGYYEFNGIMDDVRFFNWDLNDFEVAKLYNHGHGTSESLQNMDKPVVGFVDYFSGDYSVDVSGQSGKEIKLANDVRFPSYHRARRSDSLINPRRFSFLSFYRKITVPETPALASGTRFDVEVELDTKVVWSRTYGSGDEGSEEEGRVFVTFDPLSSDPRIRDIVRMDTGLDDALAFDDGKKFVEEFTAWSDYYQVAPSEYDPALTFDDGAVDTEGFAQWAVPTQIVPTSLVLNDSLAWSTAYDAPASLAYPTPTQKAIGTVDAVIVGENQPALVHVLDSVAGDTIYTYYGRNSPYLAPYAWGNGYAVWGSILFAAYATGSSVGMSICEFLPGGGGALFEGFGGVSLGSNWAAFVGDDIDNVYCTQFLSYGNSAGWELWILSSLGFLGGVIREVGHYVWSAADPFVICNLGTVQANIPSRVVLTAIPALATEVSPILITPATGPGGSASVGTFWSE